MKKLWGIVFFAATLAAGLAGADLLETVRGQSSLELKYEALKSKVDIYDSERENLLGERIRLGRKLAAMDVFMDNVMKIVDPHGVANWKQRFTP